MPDLRAALDRTNVNLRHLPEDDPLRTRPLHSIGAEYKNMKSHLGWIPATIEKLGEFSFNDLEQQWAEFNEWRAPVQKIN